jgi:ribosomal protein S18 acetylase RimI-like enzyme
MTKPSRGSGRSPAEIARLEEGRQAVGTSEVAAEWVGLSTCGFRPLDEPIAEHLFEISTRMARHPRCLALTARLAGVPAAGAAAEVYGDIGALFGTSVHPDHRRRGVQLALMIERMKLLRAGGSGWCFRAREIGIL